MSPTEYRKGLLLALLGALLLSFDTLLLRLINGAPLQVACWRGMLMFLAGVIGALFMRRKSPSTGAAGGWNKLAVVACYGLSSVTFVTSAMMTNISNMLTIIATAPLWATIGTGLFYRDWPPLRTWLACGGALAGVIIVAWPALSTTANVGLGDGLALATALLMASAFLLSRRSSANLALAPACGGLVAAVGLAPLVPVFLFPSVSQVMLMIGEGALLVPLALGMIATAPRYLPAPQVGLFLLIETVLGPFWIWAALGEVPTRYALVGGMVVILSLLAHSVVTLRAVRSAGAQTQRI